MTAPSIKHYRKFGQVTIDMGNKPDGTQDIKLIRPEQWVRIRPDTGESLFDKNGILITKKIEKKERYKNETI